MAGVVSRTSLILAGFRLPSRRDIFLSDPAKVRQAFDDAGVSICCLASSIAFARDRTKDCAVGRGLADVYRYGSAGRCPDGEDIRHPGEARPEPNSAIGIAYGDWLLPLADYAADRDVMIVIENALSFRSAKELWLIVDRINHPSIAVCWDIFNAALIGERPAVSVPVLNNRIQYAQVKDATLSTLGATYCRLGEGDVPVRQFLTRLRGIRYQGWVTLEWEKAWLPNLAEPEEIFPDSIARLREWTRRLEVSDWEHAAKGDAAPAPAESPRRSSEGCREALNPRVGATLVSPGVGFLRRPILAETILAVRSDDSAIVRVPLAGSPDQLASPPRDTYACSD